MKKRDVKELTLSSLKGASWRARRSKRRLTCTKGEEEQALILAKLYRRHAKYRNVYSRPWPDHAPIQEQGIFSHFIQTLRLAKGLHADPKEFLKVQFTHFWPEGRYPFPSQLHSEEAINRWNRKLAEIAPPSPPRPVKIRRSIAYYEDKLRRLLAHSPLTRREMLLLCPHDFSKQFLKKEGLWNEVKAQWLESWGDLEI